MITKTHLAVAGALIAATLAGFGVSAEAYLGLVALLLVIAGTVVVLMVQLDRPQTALLVLVGTAVALPLEFRRAGVAMSSSLPLAAVVCALWMLRSLTTRDASGIDRSRIVVAAMTLLGLTILSFGMGQFPWYPSPGAPLPAQIVELGLFVLSIFLFLCAGQQIQGLNQLQRLTWVFVAAGAFTCIVQVMPVLLVVGRATTSPGSVGSLFWTWFVAMTVAQALANHELRLHTRLALLGLAALALGHGIIQVRSWVSGWLPSLVAVGVIAVIRWPRLVMGLALVVLPVVLYLSSDIVAALLIDEQYSLTTRQEAWRVLWQIAERSPWLGTGLANYYYFAENYPILGWYVPFISHNNYQDLLVQTGLLGLLAFCWFGLEAVWMTFRLSLQSPPGFARAYAIAALGGTVGSLVSGMLGDWIIPFYYNAGVLGFRSSLLFWVFLGGALALRRQLAASEPVQSEAHSRTPALHHAVPSFR